MAEDRIRMKISKDNRKIAGRNVVIWTARCLEDGHTATGDTEAEAALAFADHMSNMHPGRQVRKV